MTLEPPGQTSAPRLTAVLIAGPRRRLAQASLDCLLGQTLGEMEIVLLDTEPAAAPLRRPAGIPMHEERRAFAGGQAEARSTAVGLARSPAVAFVEDHCTVAPGWADAVAKAFESGPWAVVGYTFSNANDDRWAARGVHASVYAPWMAPGVDAEVSVVATNNLAFRRDVLLALGDRLPRMIFPDAVLQQQLLREGRRFFVSGAALCAHENPVEIGFIAAASFTHCRAMAARRVELWGWGWPRRLLYAAAVPLGAPLLRLWRTFAGVAGHPRRWLPVLEALPIALVTFVAGGIGESVGYLAGAGRSVDEYERYELTLDRS